MTTQTIMIITLAVQIVLIILLIITNSKVKKKNKEMTELLTRYKDRLREDELDDAIRNELYSQKSKESDLKFVPYAEEYKDEEEVRATDAVCVHLECAGRLATKKYLINIKDELYVGKNKTNGIVLNEYDVDDRHIHLVKQGRLLFVCSVSERASATLHRGKTQYPLTDTLVQLNDGDSIVFQSSRIDVTLI